MMNLQEYFELENKLSEIEKEIAFAYGAMSDWNIVDHGEDFRQMVLQTLRKNKEEAEKLKQQIDKYRLEHKGE